MFYDYAIACIYAYSPFLCKNLQNNIKNIKVLAHLFLIDPTLFFLTVFFLDSATIYYFDTIFNSPFS